MRGYWQNEAANDEAFTSDRWFKSGDLGKLDDEGFHIVGRKKELIVTAGGKMSHQQSLKIVFARTH